MTRFIWRFQFVAASLLLSLMAAPVHAADSDAPPMPAAEAAPTADASPSAETLPPGAEVAAAPDPNAAPSVSDSNPPPTVQDSPGYEPAPANGILFRPLMPLRQHFAEHHTAPAYFPRYDGTPQYSAIAIRQAPAYEQPGPQVAEGVDPNAAQPAGGSDDAGASIGDYSSERTRAWFGGADYLLVRPHQTYDSAYQITPNGASGPSVQNVNFNPSFDSGVRLFAGFETACDESLKFSYTYMFTDTLRADAVPTGASILSPLGATLFPGDSISASEHLLLNLWDIEDVRKLNFAWCNCKDCPHWDVSWSWGVRMIQLDESITNSVDGPDAGELSQKSTFVGAGPRLGIDIRRQLGHSAFAAYVSADAALLVGEQRTTGTSTPSGSNGVQALPNFDVQLGLSWQPTCHLSVNGGYLFESFGDATQLSEASSLALLAPPQASSLSYDGFFFRGEFHY